MENKNSKKIIFTILNKIKFNVEQSYNHQLYNRLLV